MLRKYYRFESDEWDTSYALWDSTTEIIRNPPLKYYIREFVYAVQYDHYGGELGDMPSKDQADLLVAAAEASGLTPAANDEGLNFCDRIRAGYDDAVLALFLTMLPDLRKLTVEDIALLSVGSGYLPHTLASAGGIADLHNRPEEDTFSMC